MKSRIASLEGQARRADATQKALKKYVTILEKKVKDQATLLKTDPTAETEHKLDRAALLQEKLRGELLPCSLGQRCKTNLLLSGMQRRQGNPAHLRWMVACWKPALLTRRPLAMT